jgi:sulfate permease, SulP family
LKKKQKKASVSNLKGDIIGGLVAAVVAIPGNVAFGMLAFAPLGPDYLGIAVLAGMYTSVFASGIAALLGKTRIMISGPEAPSALLIAALISHILSSGGIFDGNLILAMAFITVFFSGLFQVLFGVLRLGALIKFISYPVIAGIVNGTALLIVIGQIGPFMGLPPTGLLDLFSQLGNIQMPSMTVSVVTFALIIWGRSLIPRIPASVLGIIGGTLLYYILASVGFSGGLGGDLGEIPIGLPTLGYMTHFASIPFNPSYRELLPVVIGTAFTIAVLHSVNSLLSVVYLRALTQKRPDGNLELVGQGIGNIVASCFGGLPADGHIGRSVVNYESGGRTRLSVVVSSVSILLLLIFFGKAIGRIPQAVMTGVVMGIGLLIIDTSILKMIRNIIGRRIVEHIETVVNIGIVLLVMGVTIAVDLVTAVAVGIGVSLVIFITQMSSSVIRRTHFGSNFNSKKQRFQEAMELLLKYKEKIVVVELEGALFFASADTLGQKVESLVDAGARFVVLDLKRLNRIDSTGAKILVQTRDQLDKKKCHLYISYLSAEDEKYVIMKDFGVIDAFGEENIFHDTSQALEHSEDELLRLLLNEGDGETAVPIQKLLEYNGLSNHEIRVMTDHLIKKNYQCGEYIVRQGEKGDSMFFLEKGKADVVIELKESNQYKRLLSVSPGAILGEMAILDGAPRAADIVVVDPTTCYILTSKALESIKNKFPKVAMSFYIILARLISHRLRIANDSIAELEA